MTGNKGKGKQPQLHTLGYITDPVRFYPSTAGGASRLVLGAVRCQPGETARAWCIAWWAIGKCERGYWQRVAGGTKRPFGYV